MTTFAEDHLLSLSVAEEHFQSHDQVRYDQFHHGLEALHSGLHSQTQAQGRQLIELQKQRQQVQQRASIPLTKYWQRQQQAHVSRYHTEVGYTQLYEALRIRGFDYAAEVAAELAKQEERDYGGTLRSYEQVHESVREEITAPAAVSNTTTEPPVVSRKRRETETVETVEDEDDEPAVRRKNGKSSVKRSRTA